MSTTTEKRTGRPKYKAEYPEQAYHLCLRGATAAHLAKAFRVGPTTIENWMKYHPEFREKVKAGREEADANVAASLYTRATGYNYPEFLPVVGPDGRIQFAQVWKHVPGDPRAAIHWLKNRCPDEWGNVRVDLPEPEVLPAVEESPPDYVPERVEPKESEPVMEETQGAGANVTCELHLDATSINEALRMIEREPEEATAPPVVEAQEEPEPEPALEPESPPEAAQEPAAPPPADDFRAMLGIPSDLGGELP